MSKDKSSFGFGMGLIAGVIGGIVAGVLYAPRPGSEMREKVKETVCDLAEKHSPAVNEAKRQAMESLKYKLEKQYKKFGNMLKSKKMRKAKELEELSDYDI